MDTVKTFIDTLGGTAKVADALSVPKTTIYSWIASDRIPHWRVPALEKLAKKHKAEFPDALRADKAA